MSNQAYYEQIEQNINSLIADHRYKEAYDICIETLQKYPDAKPLIKVKNRIEEEVEEMNNQQMEERLDNAEELLKKEEYIESIKIIKKLLEKYSDNKKLKKLAIKAQRQYQEHVKDLQEKFDKDQRKKIETLLKENENSLQSHLFELEKNNPGNQQVLSLTAEYRDKLIAKKIKDQSSLIDSDKYTDIKNFIEILRRIDKNSPRILKLEDQIKLKQHGTQMSAKDEFVYKGLQHLKTLMQLKKYDKAMQVAEEILAIDKGNGTVTKIYKKAQDKEFINTRNIVAEKIAKESQQLKNDYLNSKESYIKI